MKELSDEPFALIGVHIHHVDGEGVDLRELMEKENLNWRTFVDRGPIAARWKPAGTPSFFVLDPKGVIRFKWAGAPGAKAIDAALRSLLEEAERGANRSP